MVTPGHPVPAIISEFMAGSSDRVVDYVVLETLDSRVDPEGLATVIKAYEVGDNSIALSLWLFRTCPSATFQIAVPWCASLGPAR